MSSGWVICILSGVAVVTYVFHLQETITVSHDKTRVEYLREHRSVLYENLRDLNFEYKAGKLPERDYQKMKSSLEDEAATTLAEISRLEMARALTTQTKDKVEAISHK